MPARLLILGLDGLDASLLETFFQQNLCPNLSRLRSQAAYTTFLPAYPAVSPALWTSYFTGRLPLEHGLVDLLERRGRQLVPCTAASRRSPTIFGRLAAAGKKVAALGFPGTFPAETGPVMISGFDAPLADKASTKAFSSRELQESVNKLGGWKYNCVNEFLPVGSSPLMARILVRALRQDLKQKLKISQWLLQQESWDLFALHLQTADTACHHLWPQPQFIRQVYQLLDSAVGTILSMVGPETQVMILSDHGMGGSNGTLVHLNNLLASQGLLHFQPREKDFFLPACRWLLDRLPAVVRACLYRCPLPQTLLQYAANQALQSPIDFDNTAVWAQEIDASPALFINKKQTVDFCTIVNLFNNLQDPQTGEPVFKALVPAAELGNDIAPNAADYYLLYNTQTNGQRASVTPAGPRQPVFEKRRKNGGKGLGMPGVHKNGGIFWLKSPEITPGPQKPLAVTAVYPQLLQLLHLTETDLEAPVATATPTPTELAAVEEQLRRFGYID